MLRLPVLFLPRFPLSPWLWIAYILLGISLLALAFFWIWALYHAASTPRASWSQRLIWGICLLINPSATIWYWCIWKRWAFWSLFTPMLGVFLALPLVIRSMMSRADATNVTNTLFALGSNRLVMVLAILLIYPLLLRLVVILHLSKNTDWSAMEKNDWALTLALPMIGFGSALTYATKNLKPWALTSLAWLVVLTASAKMTVYNITPILIPVGDEKREEFIHQKNEQTQERYRMINSI